MGRKAGELVRQDRGFDAFIPPPASPRPAPSAISQFLSIRKRKSAWRKPLFWPGSRLRTSLIVNAC